MKTLQECKDEVARKYGFECWKDVLYTIHKRAYTSTFAFADEAAELYAAQFHKQETAVQDTQEPDPFAGSAELNTPNEALSKISGQDTQEKPDFKSLVKENFFGLSENEIDWTAEGIQWLWHHKYQPILNHCFAMQTKITQLNNEILSLKRKPE